MLTFLHSFSCLFFASHIAFVAGATVDCSTYTKSVSLLDSLLLEFVSTDTAISVRLTSQKEAYIGFGISATGKMAGAETVIGNLANEVKLYSLTDSSYTDIPASRQTLQNATFTQSNGESILEFTKLFSDGTGNQEIDGNGKNTFIFSVGYTDDFRFGHAKPNSGKVVLNLTPCGSETGPTDDDFEVSNFNSQQVFLIHGILAIIAFAFCMPLAVASAMGRNLLKFEICNKPAWFAIHYYMNVIAFILSIVLFALAVYSIGSEGGDHFEDTHELVGLITFILVTLQVGFAVFRPAAPHPHPPQAVDDDENEFEENVKATVEKEQKTSLRSSWEILHRVTAIVILGCGLYQMVSGLEEYQDDYGKQSWALPFWIVAGIFWFVLGALVLVSKKR